MDNKEVFFKLLFGETEGYLSLAFINPDNHKFIERYFKYPTQLDEAINTINALSKQFNAYFCPQLFLTGGPGSRKKDNVSVTNCAWADLDTCHPTNIIVEPSISVESSPGRYQAYWLFDEGTTATAAEDISRRIAYHHKKEGADVSGWDLTQLLRIPGTPNFKYENKPVVKLINLKNVTYTLDDFKDYKQVLKFSNEDAPIPDISSINASELLSKHDKIINPMIFKYFEMTPAERGASDNLWKLEMLLFEAGFDTTQVLAIANAAACNKYARDGRPIDDLWRDVQRAYDHHKANVEIMVENPRELTELLTTEERDQIANIPPGFVERYIEWASELTDAAKQYHQAGAFVALSSILCGAVTLPTSYGEIIPNLWFMILADTTLTRKSTAMDICTDLLTEVDNDVVMATDGSLEGLMTALSMRPKRPSVFLRDEFSGLLDSMMRKDYMAGMPEMLTKLYDGRLMKRILKKESFEVHDPRLIMFTGGIKNKVTSLMTTEQVSSGFLPRFIFITAESDITKVRPLGPPQIFTDFKRSELIKELEDIKDHYQMVQPIVIGDKEMPLGLTVEYKAELTEEAWRRYAKLEADLTMIGMQSEYPEIFTPVGDRLAKSILKAAILIAAARQREENVVITLNDILLATKYGEAWRTYSDEVISSVGRTRNEKVLWEIERFVKRYGAIGVSRSSILRTFRLQAREAKEILDTMEQRNMLSVKRTGTGAIYYAGIEL